MKKKKNTLPTDTTSSTFWRSLFAGILGSALVLAVVSLFAFGLFDNQATKVYSQADLIEFEETITKTVEDTQNAVVSVGNYQIPQASTDPFSQFSGFGYIQGQGLQIEDIEQDPVLAGTGSGVIYKIDGDKAYIITNNHVIENNDALEVTLVDGTQVEASVIGSDVYSDLAVLEISSEKVTDTIEFANSDEIKVGSIAIAIGSPLDSRFSTSVTQGIVSGLNRSVPTDVDGDGKKDWEMTLLQTDAAINPGNSGGALVNAKGQLIGISSAKIAAEQVEGIGFAIPSNDVVKIVDQLQSTGEVVRPQLGVSTYDVANFTQETRVNDLGLEADNTDGVIVAQVSPDSAAGQAGIEKYDVITAIDGEAVTDSLSLRQIVFNRQVGDTVKVTVIRQGEEKTFDVTLQSPAE